MPVDMDKKRIVLVVHGAQFQTDADLNTHETVEAAVRARLGAGSQLEFGCEIYKYEDMNDEVKNGLYPVARKLFKALGDKQPLADIALDVAMDVVINLANDSTAQKIRDGLRAKILSYYVAENPCYVLAHSLGSIYAFDVINELIREEDYFDRDSSPDWPVQALITIGSPIGLSMFKNKRTKVEPLGAAMAPGADCLPWDNMWDRLDPVVSGHVFGRPEDADTIAEKYRKDDTDLGWDINDHVVDTGKRWVASHTAYWTYIPVLDQLIKRLTY